MSDDNILIQKGKPWFSWAILIGVAMLAFSGAGIYFTVQAGQEDITKRLATNEAAVHKASDVLDAIGRDISAVRTDVSLALSDRWTMTDMRFLWSEIGLFWSEFQRLNPSVQVPKWPPAERATVDERGPR